MGNQASRQFTYEQYYETLKRSDPIAAQSLDVSNMSLDPYQVLGVRKNFEFDELKEAYRRIAKVVHPDKGGSHQLFQMVTECFRTLAYEYKMRTSDRPHHELKQEASNYYQQNPVMPKRTHAGGADDNFLDRFNRMFDENKLEDENTTGYGHMMAPSSKNRDDIDIPRMFKRFDTNTFNSTFDKVTLDKSQEVVVYREPEALPISRKIQYTELGADTPDDFSGSTKPIEGRGLQYTDFKKAHTLTRLVDPRAVQPRQNFKTVEQYESARANVLKKPETPEEIAWRLQKEKQQEEAELQRLARLKQRDHMASLHHDKVNRLMLGN